MSRIALGLWAKSDPHHLLWRHLLDVAAVCRALLPAWGRLDELPDNALCFLVGLHDLGKAHPYFQNKDADLAQQLRGEGLSLPEEQRQYRHEFASGRWVRQWLTGSWVWSRHAAVTVQRALTLHHGRAAEIAVVDDGCPEVWEPIRTELRDLLARVLRVEPVRVDAFRNASAAGVHLAGLTVMADWIASNAELFPYPALPADANADAYFHAACELATQRVQALGFLAPLPEGPASPFGDLFPGKTPRPMQAELEAHIRRGEVPPGLVIIEERMGQGKSEAAMLLLEHWRRQAGLAGAYLALPTTATSNQMHGRYRELLGRVHPGGRPPRLLHGMAWLVDDDVPTRSAQSFGGDDGGASADPAQEWFRNLRRAFLASEAVGTVDQALLAALSVRFGFLRLLGLERRALIVDEVHAYDEYMTVLLERLLNWCRALRVPVVLLSATLSRRQKQRLVEAYGAALPEERQSEYPLVTVAPLDGTPSAWTVPPPREKEETQAGPSIRVVPHPGLLENPERIAALAADTVASGGCACVLVNTVATAQAVFGELRRLRGAGALPDTELILFHARFRAGTRSRLERRVVGSFGEHGARPHRSILVATQVVEQSLDVDFDVLITELAPVDLVLQRCGRLHRHPRGPRPTGPQPVVHLLLPPDGKLDFGRTARVYSTLEPLVRSYALLRRREELVLPKCLRELIGACYDGGTLPSGLVAPDQLEAARQRRLESELEARWEAEKHLLKPPSTDDFLLSQQPPADELAEGEEATRFFQARTRLGDQTRRVLLLNGSRALALVQRETPPSRRALRWLLLQQAALPAHWFKGLTPREGFDAPASGPPWLRHYCVLALRDGAWCGTDGQDRPVRLRDDPELGVVFEREEETNPDADI